MEEEPKLQIYIKSGLEEGDINLDSALVKDEYIRAALVSQNILGTIFILGTYPAAKTSYRGANFGKDHVLEIMGKMGIDTANIDLIPSRKIEELAGKRLRFYCSFEETEKVSAGDLVAISCIPD